MHSDPFLVLTMAEDPKVLSNEVPGVLKVPNGPQVPLAGLDPSSPSPKCCKPCRPLTESLQQEKDSPMSGKPNIVPALAPVSPTSATAVGPLPPLAPPPLHLPRNQPLAARRKLCYCTAELWVDNMVTANGWIHHIRSVGAIFFIHQGSIYLTRVVTRD